LFRRAVVETEFAFGTEQKIGKAVVALRQGRTTLVTAHWYSTANDADMVVVLDGGQVKEAGPPQILASGDCWFVRLAELANAYIAAT
jgi:ABC-type multidrug transport system fused ATPase/permease subunit